MEFGEDPIAGVLREVREETGLFTVRNLVPLDVEAHIAESQEFWVTIAYHGNSDKDQVSLSDEHDDFRWVTVGEFLELKSSPKLRRFVQKLQN